MKISLTQPTGERLRERHASGARAARSLAGPSLVAVALSALTLFACRASVQGEAQLNTGQDGKEKIQDFDRPLDPAQAKAEPLADEGAPKEYALLGARHDLNYTGPPTPSCQCLAVSSSDSAANPAFQWEMGAPELNPGTQLVIAFTSNGVSCDAPPAGTLGASYQGYVVEGNDVVVFVEALGEGRPMTNGGIIPRPLGNGSVLVEPAGAIYGKPLEGRGKRCKIALSAGPPSASAPATSAPAGSAPAATSPASSAPAASIFSGVSGAKASEGKASKEGAAEGTK